MTSSTFRKSSHSSTTNCVEAGIVPGSLVYRKSSYSGSQGGNCVEAGTGGGIVGVRDTKDRGAGPVLVFAPAQWEAFLRSLR